MGNAIYCGVCSPPHMTSLATSLSVSQWLEHPTGVRAVMGPILAEVLEFFFDPRS